MTEHRMYIDGKWCDAEAGSLRSVVNPATEEEISKVPFGGRSEAARAVKAASREFPKWSTMTPYQRAEQVLALAVAIRARADRLAKTVTQEVGKSLSESKSEVLAAADQFEWYSEEVKRAGGDVVPPKSPNKRYFTLRHPVGVVAAISPWNFPLLLLSRKLAPALAAGCTVVSRPSIRAPLAVAELFGLIDEVGLPQGAANLVFGDAQAQAEAFTEMDEVRRISFTGSAGVGRQLMERAARHLKRVSLELGGHAPFVIFGDIDARTAAQKATYSKFRNMGQVCISPSRFYVHESILEEFTERAVKEVQAFRLGNGLDQGVTHGPLQSQEQVSWTQHLVDDIKSKGGTILCGGRRSPGFARGFFYEPTLASGMKGDMEILKAEPFAPILPIIPFSTEEEALREANNTPYGLAAYVLTRDLPTAIHMCEGLEAGIIALNDTSPATSCCPFGGMKQSGMGREGWHEGLEGYYETKYVSLLLD